MADERIEWTGTPSQMQNLGWFIACLLLVPIPWALWRWLVTRNTAHSCIREPLVVFVIQIPASTWTAIAYPLLTSVCGLSVSS